MDTYSSTSSNNNQITGLLLKYPVILQLLRFVAIGFLNTGLSFIIANLVSKYFGIVQGDKLGLSSGIGFIFATFQSYYWNKYWAFGEQAAGMLRNFLRLVAVGLVGFLALVFVYLGSQFSGPYYYYIILLVAFAVAQISLWRNFGFAASASGQNKVVSFVIVSLIGFFINFFIASQFSQAVHLTSNADLNKNLALVAATCVSLIWNFIGYKVIVFKK